MSWVTSPSRAINGSSITVEAAPSVGDGTITYSSSDATKATVNDNVVNCVGIGSCTITANISEGTNYLSVSTSYTLVVILNYLHFDIKSGGDIKWINASTANTLSYSIDYGNTWSAVTSANTISVAAGDTVLWKGETSPVRYSGTGSFSGGTNVRYDVCGNILSLKYSDNFENQTDIKSISYVFTQLFAGSPNIVNAKDLLLPSAIVPEYGYGQMFSGCGNLITAPSLPATTVRNAGYNAMFQNCKSLTTVPELPATTVAQDSYSSMFNGCSALTTAQTILPATTLSPMCYAGMFRGCTSLITAPELPATTLADACYYQMFFNCTSLNSIKCLATNISAKNCTYNWVNGVATSGTFTKASSMKSWTTGTSGIPSGWAVQTASS